MSGISINGIKYMYINKHNDFKKNSLNDNLYFTLRDIFWNACSIDVCMQANHYNNMLTNNISFEERTDTFQYTDILQQKYKLKKILHWLNCFTQKGWFEFIELEDGEKIIKEYMKFDDWWKQFEELRYAIREQYNKFNV